MRARRNALLAVLLLTAVSATAYSRWTEARRWDAALAMEVDGLPPGAVQFSRGLWVARQPDGVYYAFQNRSSFYADRPIRWRQDGAFFEEPVSSAQYGIDGVGRFGPAGRLYRVESRLDGKTLLVLPERIISGGPGDPAWLHDLKAWFSRLTQR